MYAIVETGGKQYQVEEGRYVDVELLGEEADSKVVFDKVVMIVNGKKSKVGQPYVEKATVEGTVIKTDRAKKLSFTNKDLKKVIEENMDIDKVLQELWLTKSELLQLKKLKLLKQLKHRNDKYRTHLVGSGDLRGRPVDTR